MKVLAGDWAADTPVNLKRDWRNRPSEIWLAQSLFKTDKYPFDQIETFEVVTEENKASVLGKLGWGAAGAIALGPLGLLAGVLAGGNKRNRVMIIAFKDGKKAMIKGNAGDAELFLAAAFGR